MIKSDDTILRDVFARLQRIEVARVPTFQRVVERPPARSAERGTSVRWALLAVAAGIVLLLSPHRSSRNAALNNLLEWQGPTDFLLDFPETEILRTVPDLDRSILPTPNSSK